jgi:glycosyltransferase involved in cell wall biosynthesis
MGMFKELISLGLSLTIDVVYWDKRHINSNLLKLTETDGIRLHPRSSLNVAALLGLLRSRKPDILFVSGWMDKGYISAARKYKKENPKTRAVCGIDDQWKNTLRQKIGRIYFSIFYRKLFDFIWVSGKPQYHFAQRMGYAHENIISNLYSADTRIFKKALKYSKRFVFVGRFDPVKGLLNLLDAYHSLPERIKAEWPLVLIGDGELKEAIEKRESKYVVVKPFMQPDELMEELMQGGVACITSHSEQWGVAIHEMAILGFPLILSSACGAATEFLITGYNGYLFKKSNTQSLHNALLKISTLSAEELEAFSLRSHRLGQRITPEHTAYSLLSVLPLSEI